MLFFVSFLVAPFFSAISYTQPDVMAPTPTVLAQTPVAKAAPVATATTTAQVPFYSQFKDISSPSWQKVGCGIASLAMIVDYYGPKVSVDTLLTEGIKKGAYDKNAGWTYAGLVSVSKKYGLSGTWYSTSGSGKSAALSKLETAVAKGPIIASVHYKLEPTNPIPHLIVVTAMKDGFVYYNDPANRTGGGKISIDAFYKAWKGRYIVIRPSATVA